MTDTHNTYNVKVDGVALYLDNENGEGSFFYRINGGQKRRIDFTYDGTASGSSAKVLGDKIATEPWSDDDE